MLVYNNSSSCPCPFSPHPARHGEKRRVENLLPNRVYHLGWKQPYGRDKRAAQHSKTKAETDDLRTTWLETDWLTDLVWNRGTRARWMLLPLMTTIQRQTEHDIAERKGGGGSHGFLFFWCLHPYIYISSPLPTSARVTTLLHTHLGTN